MSYRGRNGGDENHIHFVTFSCFRRRKLLDHSGICKIFLGTLNQELYSFRAKCFGFVVMPNHVYLLLKVSESGMIESFLQQLKQRSSFYGKRFLFEKLPKLGESLEREEAFWQPGFYDFQIENEEKLLEKLNYIHDNPVRAGLVEHAVDWKWSSARWYEKQEFVGIDISPIE